VAGCPGAGDDVFAGAVARGSHVAVGAAGYAVALLDALPAARVGRISRGRANDAHVGRAGDHRSNRIGHGDGLVAGGCVAAVVGGRPGAGDDVVAGTIARRSHVAVGDSGHAAAGVDGARAARVGRIGRGRANDAHVGRAVDH